MAKGPSRPCADCLQHGDGHMVADRIIRDSATPAKGARGGVDKVSKVMDEWKSGTLHSGSKSGPKVTSQKQAIAIALSEKRKQARGGYS